LKNKPALKYIGLKVKEKSMEIFDKNTIGSDEIVQLVGFSVGNEDFGVDILKVHEINRIMSITEIPNSPSFVEGVINLRGQVIPIINLRTRLKMPKIEYDAKTRIIVVEIGQKTVGFIVDNVTEVLRIPKSTMERPPELVTDIDTDYINSVCKLEDRLLILLDLDKVLSVEEKVKLQKV
jgi:purine-binding chemotaxis protein CheW